VLSSFHAAKRKDRLKVSNEIRVRSAKRTTCARTVYHIKILHVKGKFFDSGKLVNSAVGGCGGSEKILRAVFMNPPR